MIIRRRQNQQMATQAPSNRLLNKLVTYGLVLFVIYMIGINARQQHMVKTNPEYTPINWCNYAEVTNLLTGKTETYNLPPNGQMILKLAAADLDNIDEKDKTRQSTNPNAPPGRLRPAPQAQPALTT